MKWSEPKLISRPINSYSYVSEMKRETIDASALSSCVSPAGFQLMAVASSASPMNAPPKPAALAPAPVKFQLIF